MENSGHSFQPLHRSSPIPPPQPGERPQPRAKPGKIQSYPALTQARAVASFPFLNFNSRSSLHD
jgi:hypothetical protein